MDDNIDDFCQKYKNSFVHLSLNGKDILTKFTDTTPNHLIFYQPDVGTIAVSFTTAKQVIKTRFPKKGLYNIYGHLCFFYRVPEKQYKRCPAPGNCSIDIVGINQIITVDYDALHSCFNPVYPKTKLEAKYQVKLTSGVALSRTFGITITGTPNTYDLWYYNNVIGTVVDDQIVIEYKPLEQEARDFFGENLVWK